jgi:hypothetical protein
MKHPNIKTALFTLIIGLFLISNALAAQTDINGPAGSGRFGTQVVALPNGNIVVIDPFYDAPGPIVNVGAVYLYNGATGALISTLTGSTANSYIGESGIIKLTNGNYVLNSPNWDNPSLAANNNAGAVTWCSGTTGCSGTVGEANSLVGGTAGDMIGSSGITTLSNGNYVVRSPNWNNPSLATGNNAGAATWGNGAGGTVGVVSAGNSLIGGSANDQIGAGINLLTNGNYVLSSPNWDNPSLAANNDAGAATWCSGAGGTIGLVSASNSLVGGLVGDFVSLNGITPLTNGNYVANSHFWDNPSLAAGNNAGAVTWGNGASGTVGIVSTNNSLFGDNVNDHVGGNIKALTNGNYVVNSFIWDNPSLAANNDAGAVTWCNGMVGTIGVVSAGNSLVGGSTNDNVGIGGITALSNGNYVVNSQIWDNPSPLIIDVGAATWGNGEGGTVGLVSATNSLVGALIGDGVGNSGIIALSNGNYVVRSPNWDNPSVAAGNTAGAATWGSGAGGTTGLVSAGNSLVGGSVGDFVSGFGIIALSNGNYVVRSVQWDNPSLAAGNNAGAVTWSNGAGGTVGLVSASNSLVGGSVGDVVGGSGITPLSNGNYVVRSPNWDNPALAAGNNAGAATWGNGAGGTVGLVSASNSLVGGSAGDNVGNFGITPLFKGNSVVS